VTPVPTRERKAAPQTAPAAVQADDEGAEVPIEFQPESGALAPREPVDEEQLDHDRRDDL